MAVQIGRNEESLSEPVLVTHKDIIGCLAMWAICQHPYGRPEGLFDLADCVSAGAMTWDIGAPSLKMRYFNGAREIEHWLRGTLNGHPVLVNWNSAASGRDVKTMFTSRYDTPRPEDDFIDIDALFRNVAMSAWRNVTRKVEK